MDLDSQTIRDQRIDPTIGERVMIIRRRHGISQRDLAARAQMSPTVLNRLERGLQCVSAERLATLARLLAVSADYLLGLSLEVQPAPRAAPQPQDPQATPAPALSPGPHQRTRKAASVA
jgi:transcriptional regulator with XRE-family HTH domain